MTTMHHFQIDADRQTGEWIKGTAKYLGTIESAEHHAKKDCDVYHYDQHDGEALAGWVWEAAEVERTPENVAITIRHV